MTKDTAISFKNCNFHGYVWVSVSKISGGTLFLPPHSTDLGRPALPEEGRGNGLTLNTWGARPAATACSVGKPWVGPSRDFFPTCCPGIDATWSVAQLCSGGGWGEVLLVYTCPSPPLEGQEYSKPKQGAWHPYCRYQEWHLKILGLLRMVVLVSSGCQKELL